MNILKIIMGLILIGMLPSGWFFLGGTGLATAGSGLGIFLIIIWAILAIMGVKLIINGITD